jgi:hypothetical protein
MKLCLDSYLSSRQQVLSGEERKEPITKEKIKKETENKAEE